MNQPTTHTPGPFDKVRASAKKLGETADQMERLLNKTKSEQDRIREAAPDLLEALKKCRYAIQGGMRVDPYDSRGSGYEQTFGIAFVEYLDAAIAKATGDAV